MKRLICKLLGHRYSWENYLGMTAGVCKRCGHDPLSELKDLIETAYDGPLKEEWRETVAGLERDFRYGKDR